MSRIGQAFGSTRAVNESHSTAQQLGRPWKLRVWREWPRWLEDGGVTSALSCCLGPDGTAHWGVFCFGRTVHHAGS